MSDTKYYKIKHFVEVDDDIIVVFTAALERKNSVENLRVTKNVKITENLVNNMFAKLQANFRNM